MPVVNEPAFREVGRTLVILGGALALVGALILAGGRLPWVGRLPGDVVYRGKSWVVYAPIVTCILLSIVLTILLNLFRRR